VISWRKLRLDQCCEIVAGATPSTNVPDYWDGDICWATPKDLSELDGAYISDTPRKLTRKGLESCAAAILPAGSVLFSSRAPIGHTAVNTVAMATNQGFKSFIPRPGQVDTKFLYYWLRRNRSHLESLGNGATFKEVSKAIVSRVEITLPPLREQRRIAAVLDRADALRAKRRAALAQFDDLSQAIFRDMFGDPAANPRKWPVHEISELVKTGTIITYGIVQAGEEYPGGVPYIRTGDIVDGEIIEAGLRHTDPKIAAKFDRSRVESGEIVMSIRATVGTTAMVSTSLHGANLTQGTARIAPGGRADRLFLLHALRMPGTQDWIARQVKGATFREITLARLRELPLPLPPLPLQQKFARRVAAVEQLKSAHRQSLTMLDELFTSLQHRAFRGEL
jgi:type I restriction enzyme S subunit